MDSRGSEPEVWRVRSDTPQRFDPALVACLNGADLGLRREQVYLAPASPRWATAYHQLEQILNQTRPKAVRALAHIGSTAVPGLAAKPILDLAIGLAPTADRATLHHWLSHLGFIYRGEHDSTRPDLMYAFERDPGIRLVNAHLIDYGASQWQHYLNFRNYLRNHPADRDAYAATQRMPRKSRR
ncbi:GrpB family protein [Glutamicibacter sp. PS]|uniref:GrpB family protein n=1 Tax=Glutamicibacter sp. PS TaxID=3075634 RepID=UPI002849582C|nr:GrpB family protein [Glutamicibacter sp. PS]MDR4532702.1 GrpB family protein [Glutamicibacter sp. PS]